LARRPIPFQNGADAPVNIVPYKALIDMGYRAKRTAGVYEFALASDGLFIPCQGRSVVHGMFQPVRETVIEYKSQPLSLIQFNDVIFKEELYLRRVRDRDGSKFYVPRNVGRDYLEQLTAEKLVERPGERGLERVWEPVGPNHLGDCEKMQLVAEHLVSFFLQDSVDTPA
jgi:hypothetical protein